MENHEFGGEISTNTAELIKRLKESSSSFDPRIPEAPVFDGSYVYTVNVFGEDDTSYDWIPYSGGDVPPQQEIAGVTHHSKNLFNKKIVSINGDEIIYSDYIYLEAGTYCYSVSGGFFVGGAPGQWFLRGKYYNLDKTPKTSQNFDFSEQITYAQGNWYTTFTVDDPCYLKPIMYFAQSGSYNLPVNAERVIDYIQIESGSAPTLYEEYYDEFTYPKAEKPSVDDVLLRTKNLFNASDLIDGYLTGSPVQIRNDGAYANSHTSKTPIPLENGQTYTLSANASGNINIVILDSSCMVNSNTILANTTDGIYTFTTSFAGYAFVSYTGSSNATSIQLEKSGTKTDYAPYYIANSDYFSSIESDFLGKALYVFGDSIMAASTAGVDGVGEQLRDKYGMTLTNYAIDGRLITVRDSSYRNDTILYEIENASAIIPGYIIWNGGTNDISNWNTISHGDISTGFSATLDESTFCGAFEKTIKTLLQKYPGARIIYCTTHVNSGRDLTDQNACWELTREMCKKWGIAVADINYDSGLNTFLTEYKGVFTDAGGTHPNTNGYKLFYLPVIEHKL